VERLQRGIAVLNAGKGVEHDLIIVTYCGRNIKKMLDSFFVLPYNKANKECHAF